MPAPRDYDTDPERYRLGIRVTAAHDRDAVRDYLRARFVPPDEACRLADALAARGPFPLPVTKRGALLLARR